MLRRGLFMPWELESMMDAESAKVGWSRLDPLHRIDTLLRPKPRTAFGKVAVLESSFYMRNQLLRDTDWASMAHSLEVRVPLVDSTLLSKLAPMAINRSMQSKHLLANSPRLPLPSRVIERRKTGFSTPIQAWLRGDKRVQQWRKVPALAKEPCAWARRWAFQVAAV
jgi:asparagine synthase (glutamine-hydrolysing)